MKKIYSKPTTKAVELHEMDAVLLTVSGSNGLDDTSYDGGTKAASIEEADSRELSSKSLWDNEW